MCALCRQALASGGNAGLLHGFYWSIALIVGVQLVLVATVAVMVWRHRRRRLHPDAAGGPSDA